MSKEPTAAPETSGDDSAKKALKAEMKAAEKARKAAKALKKAAKETEKAEKKALAKIEKQAHKQATALALAGAETDEPGKNLKNKKPKSKTSSGAVSGASGTRESGLGAKLQAVARLARSRLASGLLAHGLYAGQEQVLFMLDEHGPLALAELAEKLDVRAPTITKTVTRMEGQSFLSRAISRDDARSIIIALTPDGRRVLKIARQIVQDVEAETFSGLSDTERQNLHSTLDLVLLHGKNAE